jgi:hypothetical protein
MTEQHTIQKHTIRTLTCTHQKLLCPSNQGHLRWLGRIEPMREMRNAQNIFIVKYEEEKQFRKSRHRLKSNIKVDLKETVWLRIGSNGALMNTVINLRVL